MQFWNINRQSLKALEYVFWHLCMGKYMTVTVSEVLL